MIRFWKDYVQREELLNNYHLCKSMKKLEPFLMHYMYYSYGKQKKLKNSQIIQQQLYFFFTLNALFVFVNLLQIKTYMSIYFQFIFKDFQQIGYRILTAKFICQIDSRSSYNENLKGRCFAWLYLTSESKVLWSQIQTFAISFSRTFKKIIRGFSQT